MIRLFQVDAFTDQLFKGNPASVVLLSAWEDEAWMQRVASETNVADTAFVVPLEERGALEIRWFTPRAEVPLCGHATLATAYVLFERVGYDVPVLRFASKSGELRVGKREDGRLELDFPVRPVKPVRDAGTKAKVAEALGAAPISVYRSAVNLVAVFANEIDVARLEPDFRRVAALDCHGLVVTATGDSVDFVSRYFAPGIGVDEDPVTGSAHCETAPHWAGVLGRTSLVAHQISRRGGEVLCEVKGDRVLLAGFVAPFLEGTIAGP